MITRAHTIPTREERFLAMLPSIYRDARIAFRHEPPSRREELVTEAVANAFVAFARLVERGLIDVAYPTPLAQYAVKQVRAGRRVGTRLNVRDLGSAHCQRVTGIRLRSLDTYDPEEGQWRGIVVEDRTAGPAAIAATRIDFAQWLKSLPAAKRRIAGQLAMRESTREVARRNRVTPGRISQLRRELEQAWAAFVADKAEPACA